jgi:2-polyprenyl-3-methyl-5-hydroxy-6-metoxy-1,4-benzoquinol methylase
MLRQRRRMIIHKLIALHFNYEKNAHAFFELQARDAIIWLQRGGLEIGPETRMLDLGCGHGYFGRTCQELGAQVTFADLEDLRLEELREQPFKKIDLNTADLEAIGDFDLVACSNVLEHLAQPSHLLSGMPKLLKPGGHFYLSWTNWLSPWGGHEFSPWHYLGKRTGPIHTVGKNLFPTYIGSVMREIHAQDRLTVQRMAPRYYNELAFLTWLPWVREFLTWNCAMQIQRAL